MEKEKETKKKGGCLKTTLKVLLVLLIIGAIASIGDEPKEDAKEKPETVKKEEIKKEEKKEKPAFTMFSNDTVGVSKHYVVGDKREPSGKYKVVCTSGHGDMTVNDSDLKHFANDDKKGTNFMDSVYNQESIIDLAGNDVIRIKNHNSSDYELEFFLIEAGAEPEIPIEHKNALKKAQQYSNTMFMSKQAIYDQLVSEYGEHFTPEAAQYAIDTLDTDYNRNALEKAKTYQNDMSMSKEAIREQLVSEYGEQFTQEEADYAISNLE